jgi:Fe-S cluster biogenesis protein NfuA
VEAVSAPHDLRATGERIEQLLDELQSVSDTRSYNLAGELLRLVSDLYGAGLARVVALTEEQAPELLDSFGRDDLVASLLLVLGMHPKSLAARVADALEEVRPFLASHSGGVELLGIDAEAGAVQLRLLGSCDGCPSSSVTLHMAVERAILEAAPEIARIDVDKPSETVPGVPISLSIKPTYTECPVGVTGA